MKILITGASGFIGRTLVTRLLEGALPVERLTLLDMQAPAMADGCVRAVGGDIGDRAVRERALEGGVDVVFHLAGVLSATAEKDYALSRRVNLDATLALFEEAARAGRRPRVVYSSSIAVFGANMPARVDDETQPAPTLIYGAHKLMSEIALADFSRRGELEGLSVRFSGVLARPEGSETTRSAFMSDIFHAFARGETFTSPVSREAAFWVHSVVRCVDNLVHAARMDTGAMPRGRAVTLPALRLSVPQLADALARATGRDTGLVSYAPIDAIESVFGRYPALATPQAERLGFRHDGDADRLVKTVLKSLQPFPERGAIHRAKRDGSGRGIPLD